MVQSSTGVAEASLDVLSFKVWEFLKHLLLSEAGGKQVEDIDNPNPHPPNAGATAALLRIHGDSFSDLGHWHTSSRVIILLSSSEVQWQITDRR